MTNDNERPTSLNEPVDAGEREVRQLLEQAGRRPEIPAADFRTIKAAARVEWQQLVDARKSRKWWSALMTPLPAAAGILAVLALALWWSIESVPPAIETVASVELLRGDVRLEKPAGEEGAESDLAEGGSLAAGVELVTGSGPDQPSSLLAVRLINGQSVRLGSGSRARLASDSRIELLEGAVYVDSGPAPSGQGRVEISTPFGTVFDIGTQFEVRVGDAEEPLRIRVRTGAISLVRERDQHSASVGEELLVRHDGSVNRGTYEPFGIDWDWILSAAPTVDIEGLRLSDFLAWVATETGLEVRYEDQVLAEAAATIELHGSIEGLRPDEAAIAVLPGTGLAHRVGDGGLFIKRLPPGGGGV